jgi:uncharacterized linocin/CFP29 family protein
MIDILKRSLAPISGEAWKYIDETALMVVKANLSARRLIGLDGPHGWGLGAVNLGRLGIGADHKRNGVSWGLREVLPLVEVRVPFKLDIMELDSVSRGSKDADVDSLEKAAAEIAAFEETAVYKGFPEGGIKGILEVSPHAQVKLPGNFEDFPKALAEAIKTLRKADVDGPFAVVLGTRSYHELIGAAEGYPTFRMVQQMVEGGIHRSPALEGGLVISLRGGDFELTLGQDISIGYAFYNQKTVELYFTESFTSRIFKPEAAIGLKA